MNEVFPTLLSPMSITLIITSQCLYIHIIIPQMQIRGKQIKNYIIGQEIVKYHQMSLLEGRTIEGHQVSLLMSDQKYLQNQTFAMYTNMLRDNLCKVYPQFIEPLRSSNNIYVVFERVDNIEKGTLNMDYKQTLAGLLELYRNIGQFKVEVGQIFITKSKKIVYLPFYRHIQTSSKFYAKFHNKSTLGEIFANIAPITNRNRSLQIFLQNIDANNALELIINLVQKEKNDNKGLMIKGGYPEISMIEDKEDQEQIMRLMSQAKVNANMKSQANHFSMRTSVKAAEQEADSQMNQIMQQAQSSMSIIKKPHKSSEYRSRMQVKISQSKLQTNQFDVYFKSYYESLRFLKRAIKVFLSYYRNGFAGIVSSYLLITVLTLRKAYMIKDLQMGMDIFDLGISMSSVPIHTYTAMIKHQLRNEMKMIAELRVLLENCQMPIKTYTILQPFLQQDVSNIDMEQLQSFTFFFLTALMKNRQKKTHFMYFIDVMYILLHRNYEIVFFESEFPQGWNEEYFDMKVAMIGALVPNWSMF